MAKQSYNDQPFQYPITVHTDQTVVSDGDNCSKQNGNQHAFPEYSFYIPGMTEEVKESIKLTALTDPGQALCDFLNLFVISA